MGTFTVPIQVGDLDGQRFIELEALVDTGATYTVLPKELLDQLGIEQEGRRSFELGDDRVVKYPIGNARMRLNGDQTIVLVGFGAESTAPLLGATALENLSLTVDPVNQRLIPVPALLKQTRQQSDVRLPQTSPLPRQRQPVGPCGSVVE